MLRLKRPQCAALRPPTLVSAHACTTSRSRMSLNDPQWGKRGNQRRSARSRRDLAQRQPPPERAVRPQARTPATAGDGGGGRGARLAARRRRACWSRWSSSSGSPAASTSSTKAAAAWSRASASTPRPRSPARAGTCRSRSRRSSSSTSRRCKTVEVGYRNTPKNKVDKEALMLTDDENIIDIQFAVQYNLKSAEAYLFNNRKPDQIVAVRRARRRSARSSARARWTSCCTKAASRSRKQTEKLMQEMLDRYGTGIYVQKVTLQSVQPPDKVQAAFDDAVKAGQDRERLKNEGQAYANDVVPRARGRRRACSRKRTATRPRSCSAPKAMRRASARSWPNTRRRPASRATPVPRHDAVGARQLEQGAGRPEGRQQPALPAARQADPAERRRRRRRRDARPSAPRRRVPPTPDAGAGARSVALARRAAQPRAGTAR